MKPIYFLLSFVLIAFTSCSDDGEIGPQGPQGPQGEPGVNIAGTVFDVQGDFTDANEYTLFVDFAEFTDVEVLESDVVLVYLRVGTDGEAGGEPVYVWRLLPQTYYLEGGETMQYNYDYTFFDATVFLDASVDLATLGPEFTDDQVFRIAILPADFAQDTGVDVSNYEAVMSALDIQESEIPQLELK
ncbi:collagen-like protein [Salinimicrobium catena]|uniref:collagen-like protein n=1 Tax=Salinimicrobium catena TaxID=390640 RepID=UPI002FE447EB